MTGLFPVFFIFWRVFAIALMLRFAFSFVLDLEFGLFGFTAVWYVRQLDTEPAHTDPFCNHCLSVNSFLYSYLYLYLRRYTTGGGEGLTAGRRLLPDYYWLLATSTPEPSSTDQPQVQRQRLFYFLLENWIQLAQLCVTRWWSCVLGQYWTLWGGSSY